MRIHFNSGGNFLHYYLGVAAKFQKKGVKISELSGVSAGAITASLLAWNIDIDSIYYQFNKDLCKRLKNKEQIIKSFYDILSPHFHNKSQIYPLKIWTTKINIPYIKEHCFDHFENNNELFHKMMCSCFIPSFGETTLKEYKGSYYLDGAFTYNNKRQHDLIINYKDHFRNIDIMDKIPKDNLDRNQILYEYGKYVEIKRNLINENKN